MTLNQLQLCKQAAIKHLEDAYNIPSDMAALMIRDSLLKLSAITDTDVNNTKKHNKQTIAGNRRS